MTREKAAERVVKLRRLATGNNNPKEAEAARRQADQLILEHKLTETELSSGSRIAAFDELLGELDAYVRRQQVPTAVFEAIERMKKDTKNEDKAKALKNFVVIVRAASLFINLGNLKEVVDRVLTKH